MSIDSLTVFSDSICFQYTHESSQLRCSARFDSLTCKGKNENIYTCLKYMGIKDVLHEHKTILLRVSYTIQFF